MGCPSGFGAANEIICLTDMLFFVNTAFNRNRSLNKIHKVLTAKKYTGKFKTSAHKYISICLKGETNQSLIMSSKIKEYKTHELNIEHMTLVGQLDK